MLQDGPLGLSCGACLYYANLCEYRAGGAGHEYERNEDLVVRTLGNPDPARPEHGAKPDSERAFRNADRQLAREQDAGDRSEQQPAHRAEVDVPVNEVADARNPERRGRAEDVR